MSIPTRPILASRIASVPSHHRPAFPEGWSRLLLPHSGLSLANTLPVGQSFLWHRHALTSTSPPLEEFSRAINHPPRVVCLRQTETCVYYTAVHPNPEDAESDRANGTTRQWLEDYFQITRYPDLESLYEAWRARDPKLFGKAQHPIGVRVLRQDPWECLIAFITSSNNHIPRITSLMHRLAQHFMPPLLSLDDGNQGVNVYHLFPPPHSLPDDSESVLRELGFGYRAAYLEASLQALKSKFGSQIGDVEKGLEVLRGVAIEEARKQLLELKGVGRKVADCVLLMSLDKASIIPIDTHIGAIAARHPGFPRNLRNKPMSKQVYEDVQQFLLDTWGPLGGWCQAVMFASDLPSAKRDISTTPVKSIKSERDLSTTPKSIKVPGKVTSEPGDPSTSPLMKRTRGARRRAPSVDVKADVKIEDSGL